MPKRGCQASTIGLCLSGLEHFVGTVEGISGHEWAESCKNITCPLKEVTGVCEGLAFSHVSLFHPDQTLSLLYYREDCDSGRWK